MDQPAATVGAYAQPRPRLAESVRAVLAEARTDRWLYAIIAAYLLGGWAVAVAVGRGQFFLPWIYLPIWLKGMASYLAVFLLVADLPRAIKDNPGSPLSAFAARVKQRVTPRFFAGLMLFTAAGVFTGVFTCMKSLLNDVVGFHADVMMANLDAAIHGGVDPWKLIHPLLGHHWVTRGVQHLYLSGWTVFLLTFTGAAAMSAKLAPLRIRFFVTYFLTWILLGNFTAAAFMSGGPVYYAELTGSARFAGLMDYLSFSEGMVNSSVAVRELLWSLHSQRDVQLGTGISAFPSLHVAMVTLFALTAFHIDRRLGWLMVAFAVVIQLGSVHLGWHYAVDGYASALAVAGLWFGVGWALKRTAKPAP
jgi:hypothetical protein